MPAHSRSQNGVAEPVIGTRDFARSRWLAYVAGIHVFSVVLKPKTWMAGTSPAMTVKRYRHADRCASLTHPVALPASGAREIIHSAFSPASLMTLPHFAISDLKNAVHCSGELPIGT